MKRFLVLFSVATACFAALQPVASRANELGVQANTVHTNFVDRWITNTAELQLTVNRFVTEYHTNWISLARTNLVNLFSTNLITSYHTNRILQVRTNFVDVFSTNIIPRLVTNTFVLDAVQTNFVQAYQTNLKTLTLTNWTTVIALKTNWVTKPLTNLVEIEMTRESVLVSETAVRTPVSPEPLVLQATRSTRPTANNQVEVQLTAAWTQPPATPVRVLQWRIEREDGSILCFGQDPEFKRALPEGTYKVQLRAQRDSTSPLLAALGTLTVTPREVLLEQRPAHSNSSI